MIIHTGYAAIENVNTIDKRRSKLVSNRVFDCHLSHSKTMFLVIFDPRSSIAKSVFDCRLSGVLLFAVSMLGNCAMI